MDRLAIVRSPRFLDHGIGGGHPESPERLKAVDELFAPGAPFANLPVLPLRSATDRELLRVHAKHLIETLVDARGSHGWFDPDTYFNDKSVETALLAAGSTIDLALAIQEGRYRRGFSLVRPPGHHATPDRIMGFCLINHVALAAQALREAKPGCRVAIVDFDLHHGNGTQDIFYRDPDVLFLSSHRFPFYPGTGRMTERGESAGLGTTINFPLNEQFAGEFFLRLYGEVAMPLLEAFAPDFVLVSAGFDGHARDPMDGFRISTESYGKLAAMLVSFAENRGGKILFCLEGGYDPPALRDSVGAVLQVLNEGPGKVSIPGASEGEAELETFADLFRTI